MGREPGRIAPLIRPFRLAALRCNKPRCRAPVAIIGLPIEPIEPLLCWCGAAHARIDGWPFLVGERQRRSVAP